jgi:hypothetical protein
MLIANDWDEEERRNHERYAVDNYLRVLDKDTSTLLGHVVDISTAGMKLLSDSPINNRREYRMVLDISMDGGPRQKVALTGRSTWSDEDINPGLYTTGFCFLSLSPEAKAQIEELISILSAD